MSHSEKIVFKSDELELYRLTKLDSKWQTFKLIFKFHPEKGKFSIGWNGSRFAAGTEFDRLNKFSPAILRHLEIFLKKHYSDGAIKIDSTVLELDWIDQLKAGRAKSDLSKAHENTERKQQ